MGPCDSSGKNLFSSASEMDLSSVISCWHAVLFAGANATKVRGDAVDEGLGDVRDELDDDFGDACWGEPDDKLSMSVLAGNEE